MYDFTYQNLEKFLGAKVAEAACFSFSSILLYRKSSLIYQKDENNNILKWKILLFGAVPQMDL